MKRAMLVFHPRCGSSWLISIFAKNPKTFVRYEILDTVSAIKNGYITPRNQRVVCVDEQIDIIDKFYREASGTDTDLAIFKAAPYQCLDLRAIRQYARENEVRTIFMTRRNVVRTAVSQLGAQLLAQRTGHTNVVKGIKPVHAFELEKKAFFGAVFVVHQEMSYVLAARELYGDLPNMWIEYEDLVSDPTSELERISGFLGHPIRQPNVEVVSRNLAESLSGAVKNYSDLETWVRGTCLDQYLQQ